MIIIIGFHFFYGQQRWGFFFFLYTRYHSATSQLNSPSLQRSHFTVGFGNYTSRYSKVLSVCNETQFCCIRIDIVLLWFLFSISIYPTVSTVLTGNINPSKSTHMCYTRGFITKQYFSGKKYTSFVSRVDIYQLEYII